MTQEEVNKLVNDKIRQMLPQIIQEVSNQVGNRVPGVNSPLLDAKVSILGLTNIQQQIDDLDARISALEP